MSKQEVAAVIFILVLGLGPGVYAYFRYRRR